MTVIKGKAPLPERRTDGWYVALHGKEWLLAPREATRETALENYADLLHAGMCALAARVETQAENAPKPKSKNGSAHQDRVKRVAKKYQAFLKAWNSSSSAKQAAERLGVTNVAASARASYLRSRGVKVKRFAAWPEGYVPGTLAAEATKLLKKETES